MKKSIISILVVGIFVLAMPFMFNKSIDVAEPHKLDIDGNFIMYDWHYDDFKEESRVGTGPDWDYNLKPVQVSDRVWCFFGAMEMPTKENAGDMSNSCYIKGDTEWIAWDSGPSYVFAKQAYAKMKEIADMPVKNVLISHEHDDHWLGNNYYKEQFGAKIIGPESVNENYFGPRHIEGKDYPGMQTRMIKALYQNATRDTVLALTDEAFHDTTELEISGVKLEYVKVGYVHSEEDWYLYLPDDKVVLAADTVMNGRVTSNRDGLVVGQINALNSIKSRDWDYLVPGHGFITDKTAADETVLYFDLLRERIIDKMDEGVIADFITKEVTLNEFRNMDLYYILSPQNVFRSYEELEMFDEDDLIDYEALKEEAAAEKAAKEAAEKAAAEKAQAQAQAEDLAAKNTAEAQAGIVSLLPEVIEPPKVVSVPAVNP